MGRGRTRIQLGRRRRERGSAPMALAFLVTMLGGLAFALTTTTIATHRETRAYVERQRLRHLAQAQVNEGWARLNSQGADSLRELAADTRKVDGIDTDLVAVYGDTSPSLADDLIRLIGIATHDGEAIAVELVVRRSTETLRNLKAFGDSRVTLNSSAVLDSYNSEEGSYASQAIHDHDGEEYANDNAFVGSNGNIYLDSNSVVFGDANPGPGGSVSVQGNAFVSGNTSPLPQTVHLQPVHVPSISPSGSFRIDSAGSGVLSPGAYHFTSFEILSNAHLSIVGPAVIVLDEGVLDSNATVVADTTDGDVVFYVMGPFSILSNAVIAPENDAPSDLLINIAAEEETIVIGSNASVTGQIYAPDSSIEILSNAEVFGSVVAETLYLDSNPQIHIDEALFDTLDPIPTYEKVTFRPVSVREALALRAVQVNAGP